MDKLPDWFYQGASGLILIALASFFYITLVGSTKIKNMISTLLKHDEHVKELQTSMDNLRIEHTIKQQTAEQLSNVLFNIKPMIDTLNNLKNIPDHEVRMYEANNLIQRALDTLASDIKTESGGRHRCGMWVVNEERLQLVYASHYFPKHYIGNIMLP